MVGLKITIVPTEEIKVVLLNIHVYEISSIEAAEFEMFATRSSQGNEYPITLTLVITFYTE